MFECEESYHIIYDPQRALHLADSVIASQREAATVKIAALAKNEERLDQFALDQNISK